MTVFETDSRKALAAGIVATTMVALVGVALLAASFGATSPVLGVLALLLGFAGLGLSVWLGIRTYQLANLSYAIDRNALVIRAGPIRQIVPLRDVERLIFGHEIAEGLHFQRIPFSGWWIGRGRHVQHGKIDFYATQPIENQLIVMARSGVYALSPYDEDAFIETLNAQLAVRPSKRVESAKIAPSLARLGVGLLEDRLAWVLLIVGLAINFILFGISAGRLPSAPSQLVLHFNAAGLPDRYGSSWQLFLPALFGFVLFAVNFVVGLVSYRQGEELASYLIWGGNVAIQLMFLIALVTIGFATSYGT